MLIHKMQLPIPEQEFRAKLAEYLAALAAHALTEGEPAPFPEFEIFRAIAAAGGTLDIYEDDEPPIDDTLPAPLRAILGLERANPFTPRALREFFIGFGDAQPAFTETLLYKRAKAVDDAIKLERAKL